MVVVKCFVRIVHYLCTHISKQGGFRDYYPQMNFKVSSNDVFGKTAIMVEVKERFSKKSQSRSSGEDLASDYWDIIPKDVQQEESSMKPNRRILSHAQVAFQQIYQSLYTFLSFKSLFSFTVLSYLIYQLPCYSGK